MLSNFSGARGSPFVISIGLIYTIIQSLTSLRVLLVIDENNGWLGNDQTLQSKCKVVIHCANCYVLYDVLHVLNERICTVRSIRFPLLDLQNWWRYCWKRQLIMRSSASFELHLNICNNLDVLWRLVPGVRFRTVTL